MKKFFKWLIGDIRLNNLEKKLLKRHQFPIYDKDNGKKFKTQIQIKHIYNEYTGKLQSTKAYLSIGDYSFRGVVLPRLIYKMDGKVHYNLYA